MLPTLFLAAVLTARFAPAAPAVGDPVTIEFPQPVVVAPSPHYEILSQHGNRAVVRTFEPKPFTLTGRIGALRFDGPTIPIRSVLAPNDPLQPAPLRPPVPPPPSRVPTIAIVTAAGCALLTWTLLFWLDRRRRRSKAPAAPYVPPDERFRTTVTSLRDKPRMSRRWSQLADATRTYLAAVDPELGVELTTSELLTRLESLERSGLGGSPSRTTVAQILSQGDLEKFSPWGPFAEPFEDVASRALELIR